MQLTTFTSRPAASAAVAEQIAAALRRTLAKEPRASLALSGGSTPKACYELLATLPLPWSQLDLCLTDERLVEETHPASNARMLSETLLRGSAGQARLVPLTDDGLARLPARFSATLLGMGTDGHFASLFPDASNLSDGLNLESGPALLNVKTNASPHARRSLGLRRLLATDLLLLLIFGAEKLNVLEDRQDLPIHALCTQEQTILNVFWAP